MHYIKYMPYHTMLNDSRDRRELMTAVEQGFEVSVFSTDTNKQDLLLPESVRLIPVGTKEVIESMPRITRVWYILKNRNEILKRTRMLNGDVLSCYDIDSLILAYCAFFLKRDKPLLIYDSHEFEIGRHATRSKFNAWKIRKWEQFLIKRCAYSTMVNDSIADEVQRIHRLKQRPVVLRSTPTRWNLDSEKIAAKRKEFLEALNHPKWLLMYHGILTTCRGIENTLKLTALLPGVGLVILGNSRTKTYEKELKTLVKELHLEQRVLFHEAVPIDELSNFVGAVDIGMIIPDVQSKSYYYGLPNKFFENIQSLTPIIATDIPEMRKIIDKYNIGLTCPAGDIEAAKACVVKLMTDPALYQTMKNNLVKAKNDLCWENEKKRLIEAWEKYLKPKV